MVCWVVPLTAAIAGLIRRKASHSKGARSFWLNIMLLGGAVFGMVDHAWNGELFMIGANWMSDIALGMTITAGITASWAFIAFKPEIASMTRHVRVKLGFMEI